VIQKRLKTLGRFDLDSGTITIREDQPEAGKHVVLLHELLHFTAELMVQHHMIRKHPDESFITHAAPVLLNLLVRSGLWNGLPVEDLDAFIEAERRK